MAVSSSARSLASPMRAAIRIAAAAWIGLVLAAPENLHAQTLEPGETITVSIGPVLPPLYFHGVDGTSLGFVPDLVREAASRAGVSVEFEYIPDYDTFQRLDPEEHPLVAWLLAEERPEGYIGFERSYVTLHAAAFRRKASFFTKDLRASQLGEVIVVRDTEVERDLLNNAWDSLHPVTSVDEAFQLLASGSYDTILVSEFPGHYALENLNLHSIHAVHSTEMHMHQHLKLLRTRYRSDLETSLAPAFASMREDGTYDRLFTHWFGKYQPKQVPAHWFGWTVGIVSAVLLLMVLGFVLTQQRFRSYIRWQGQALETSESRLTGLVEGVEAIVWEAGLDAHFAYVSPHAEKLLGYPVSDWYKPNFFADVLLHPEDRDEAIRTCHEASMRGEDHVLDYRARTSTGDILWLHEIVRVVKDERGNPLKLHGVMIDVSDMKQAQQAVATSEARLAATIAASPTGIIRLDTRGRVTFSNQEAARITGIHSGSVDMKRWLEAIHPDDRDSVSGAWHSLATNPGADMREYRFVHEDGEVVWVLDRGHPEMDANGNFAGYVTTLTDITPLKRAEETVQSHSQVLMHLTEAVNFTDEDGTILYTNAAFDKLFGYAPGELIGKSIAELNHVSPEAYAKLSTEISAALAANESWSGEFRNRHRNGREFWSRAHVFRIEGIGPRLAVCVQEDITEQRRAELALRESEERFRRIAESALVGIAIFDGERFVFSNNSMVEIAGYSPEELVGLAREDIARMFLPDDSHLPVFSHLQRLDTEEVVEGPAVFNELRIRRKDGSTRCVNLTVSRLYPSKPFPRMFLCADVTDRIRAESTLRTRSQVLMNMAEGVCFTDADGIILETNPAYDAMFGYERGELIGKHTTVLSDMTDAEVEAFRLDILRGFESNGSWSGVFRDKTKDGRRVWARARLTRTEVDGNPGIVAVQEDISEARRAEQALRESEALFRAITEQIPDAVFLVDFSDPDVPGEIVYANESAARMHGMTVDEIIGKTISELDDPATARHIPERRARMLSGETINFEGMHRRKDGTVFPVEVVARRVDTLGDQICLAIDRDLTDRKRMEDEQQAIEQRMLQAQKLESLGILAGGIAHDFNNLLVGILGNAQLAREDVSPGSPVAASLEQIEIASKRAAELTHQMLAYSGKGKFVVQRIHLDAVVREMAKLLEVSLSKRAVLRFELEQAPPAIEGDSSQIQQVVMNLITNASDALGDRAGVITIRSGAAHYREEALQPFILSEPLVPGEYVFIEVSDTGCGMDPETVQRIFDPFFTTKFAGRGLGLASVLGIVRSHRGGLRVSSRKGAGTSFRVIFPAAPGPATPLDSTNGHDDHAKRCSGGAILVVDDEPRVTELIARALERFGFEVVKAYDGPSAVDAFNRHASEIRCAIIDVTMPGMNGEDVFAAIREIRPDVPALFVSGYAGAELAPRIPSEWPFAFLQKPFSIESLRQSVEALLETAERGVHPS